ncbi:PH domain-containing protein [Qipengyuania flava]|nr:PH domain-containing protein [Qipengyuania flava]
MTGETAAPRRTNPMSFAVRAVGLLAQLVVPVVLGGVAILNREGDAGFLAFAVPILIVVILLNVLVAYLQWARLTYTIGESDVRVESGVLSRSARSVPYDRIQDVSLEQKLLPRLFGLVEVKFETGAGGGDDLTLAYLSEAEGERLRELVRDRKDDEPARAPVLSGAPFVASAEMAKETKPAPQAETVFAMDTGRILTFGLFEFSLAVVAVLFGAAQQLDFLLPFDPWDVDGWQQQLAGPGQWLAGLGPVAKAAGIALAIAALVPVGIATGVIRTALREWDFRLEHTPKGLRRRRGLLTRTDLVMPLHRVQALRMETGFIRRRFGWHALKIVSLASDSEGANHDAVPFGTLPEIDRVIGLTGFHRPAEDVTWLRATPRYFIDRVVGAGIALVILAIVAAIAVEEPLWILPLLAIVPIAGLGWWRWKRDRRALDQDQVYNRIGSLAPKLSIASRVKLQSVEIAQGPIARWRGYATLHLGLAGGKFRIKGVPLTQAEDWRAHICRSMAGTDFSRLLDTKGSAAA